MTEDRRSRNVESRALLVGTVINGAMGVAGLVVYLITDIQALLLDAAFTIIAVISGLVSIAISSTSSTRSQRYPYGRFALESLYMLAKSVLIIALMALTLWKVSVKAYDYWRYGTGEAMNIGPVIFYEIIMVTCGFMLYAYLQRRNHVLHDTSSLLDVEATNTRIDALMSGGIGVAALVVSQIPMDSPFAFLLYTGDFFITLVLTIFTVKDPLVMCGQAWAELSNGILTSGGMHLEISRIVGDMSPSKTTGHRCMVFRQGKGLRVAIPIVGDTGVATSAWRDAAVAIRERLAHEYGHVVVEYVIGGQDEERPVRDR
jgi:predicted Co/Zn/Cd cation transporter (cation efflux family)